MREVPKEYAGDSGPSWILDLEGPDGNVYALWGILQQFADLYGWESDTYEGEMIEESKQEGGYEGVLAYCLHHLSPSPAGIEFRMYGHEVGQVSDYNYALEQAQGE